jgi:hypothetical protein
MRNRPIRLICALLSGALITAMVFAQGRSGGAASLARIQPSDKKFDPRDLAGI